jgi:hypothetical protein
LFLHTPKWLLISGLSHLAHAKKQHQIKEVCLEPYKTRQNPKNLYVFPKVNNRKRHESFKNHNFLCAQKILENQ